MDFRLELQIPFKFYVSLVKPGECGRFREDLDYQSSQYSSHNISVIQLFLSIAIASRSILTEAKRTDEIGSTNLDTGSSCQIHKDQITKCLQETYYILGDFVMIYANVPVNFLIEEEACY